jgi:hypothetical protein
MGNVGSSIQGAVQSIGSVMAPGIGSGGSLFDGSLAKNLGQGQFEAQAYNIDPTAFQPNGDENAWVKSLQTRAAGQGPSVAEQQMHAGADMASQNAMGMAAAQRGINPAMAARMAAQSQAQISQSTNRDAGMMRAQEQMGGQQMLGQALQSQRQARMNQQALGVEQQTGMNHTNQMSFDSSQKRRGDLIGGLGGGAMAAAMSKGGIVQGFADGGVVDQSSFAESLQRMKSANDQMGIQDKDSSETKEGKAAGYGLTKLFSGGGGGGAGAVGAGGGATAGAGVSHGAMMMMAAKGAMVPGQAQVQGDSKKNDTVPAVLSPGEMVIPRTVVAGGPDAVKRFAQALMKKGGA